MSMILQWVWLCNEYYSAMRMALQWVWTGSEYDSSMSMPLKRRRLCNEDYLTIIMINNRHTHTNKWAVQHNPRTLYCCNGAAIPTTWKQTQGRRRMRWRRIMAHPAEIPSSRFTLFFRAWCSLSLSVSLLYVCFSVCFCLSLRLVLSLFSSVCLFLLYPCVVFAQSFTCKER